MIIDLKIENNLRGYSFEHIAKILLRRNKKNNFIFVVNQFDSIEEILTKYRIKIGDNHDLVSFIGGNWNKFDLIEFKLNNKKERTINGIILYDVKTNYYLSKKRYHEFCESNYDFIKRLNSRCKFYIISIILCKNWRFSINIESFNKEKIRVYSRYKKNPNLCDL